MSIGANGFTAYGALQAAAAATSVCSDVRPCFDCALTEFIKEKTPRQNSELQRNYKLFSVLLTEYVNTFGAAWLFAQGVMPTIVNARRRSGTHQPVEQYTPGEVARLLRGFALFFVLFKVDAPEEIQDAWLRLTIQLGEWLAERGYVAGDFQLSLAPSSDDVKINAICGAGLIKQAAAQNEAASSPQQDARHGEPFYMVSRVAPGKLWFLYNSGSGQCKEFGPVIVPPGTSNFIKPGWCLDCKFVRSAGRWHITELYDVLPV